MKYLATKERRRDREEFVYRHRKQIKNIIDSTPAAREIHSDLFVSHYVRPELGYSVHTGWKDIWCSISKTFKSLNL